MKWIQYVFYRIFLLYRKKHDASESAFTAIIFVSLFLFMNIFVIGAILNKFDLLPVFFSLPIQGIMFMVGLFIAVYFLILYKKKYLEFINRFKKESISKRKINGWLVVVYIFISTILLYLVPLIKH